MSATTSVALTALNVRRHRQLTRLAFTVAVAVLALPYCAPLALAPALGEMFTGSGAVAPLPLPQLQIPTIAVPTLRVPKLQSYAAPVAAPPAIGLSRLQVHRHAAVPTSHQAGMQADRVPVVIDVVDLAPLHSTPKPHHSPTYGPTVIDTIGTVPTLPDPSATPAAQPADVMPPDAASPDESDGEAQSPSTPTPEPAPAPPPASSASDGAATDADGSATGAVVTPAPPPPVTAPAADPGTVGSQAPAAGSADGGGTAGQSGQSGTAGQSSGAADAGATSGNANGTSPAGSEQPGGSAVGSDPAAGTPATVTSSSGATITSSDGNASVTISAGAVVAPTVVAVAPNPTVTTPDTVVADSAVYTVTVTAPAGNGTSSNAGGEGANAGSSGAAAAGNSENGGTAANSGGSSGQSGSGTDGASANGGSASGQSGSGAGAADANSGSSSGQSGSGTDGATANSGSSSGQNGSGTPASGAATDVAAAPAFAVNAVVTLHYDDGIVGPPQVYAIRPDGSTSALDSDVDPAGRLVSALIDGPGSFFAGRPKPQAPPTPATVTGVVTRPDQTPLPGAVVTATAVGEPTVRTVTDNTGSFTLPVIGGTWAVNVDPVSNFVRPATQSVDVSSSDAHVSFVVAAPVAQPGANDAGAPEVVGLRTRNSRTFLLPSGLLETIAYESPISYRGPDGSWQLIDTTLTDAGAPGQLTSTSGAFTVHFSADAGGGAPLDTIKLAGGTTIGVSLVGAASSQVAAEGANGAVYGGVQPGVALHYIVGSTSLKESIELADRNAPSAYTFKLTSLTGPRLSAQRRDDGSWLFKGAGSSSPLFVLEAPTVGDASTFDASLLPTTGTQSPAVLDVESLGDGSFLTTVRIDPVWLHDPGRVFPILIDPTVTISPDSRDAVFQAACPTCTPSVGTTVNVGGGVAGANNQLAAVQFDLAGAPVSGITGGTLSLWWSSCAPIACGTTSGSGQQGDIGLYQIASAWNTTTTTTNDLAFYSSQLSHTTLNVWSGGDQPGKWVTWSIPASALTNWRNGTVTNNGLLLGPVGPTSQFDFLAAASGDATHSPQLAITWSGDASVLNQAQIVHSNGAELTWSPFPASTGAHFLRYEIYRWLSAPNVAPSGNEITDTSRSQRIEGDGRTSDSSYGIWESTTNLVTNGGFESNVSGWYDRGTGSTLVQSATGAQFGSRVLTVSNGVGTPSATTTTSIAVTPGSAYTASAWVSGIGTAFISFDERTSADAHVADYSGVTVTLTSTPQRISVIRTPDAGDTLARLVVTGSAGGTMNLDGVQLEQKAFATPFVDTSTATASRNAGRVQESTSDILTAAQGWVAARIRLDFASTANGNAGIFEWGDSPTNRLTLSYTSGSFQFTKQISGTTVTAAISSSFSAGTLATIIAAWDATGIKLSLNGGAFVGAGDTHAQTFAATQFDIGSIRLAGLAFADSDVLWFGAGTGKLTNADAAAFGGIGSTDPTTAMFTAQSEATLAWSADFINTNPLPLNAYTPIATIGDPAVTRYVDTTAGPNRNFSYQIVTVTDSAATSNSTSNILGVQTPADGQAVAMLQPDIASALAVILDSSNPNTNYGTYTIIGAQGSGVAPVMRSLVKFDLREIAGSATITSATLSVYTTAYSGTPGALEVHRVTSDWNESQATWSQRQSGVTWTTAGGDFDPTAAAVLSTPGPIGSWHSFDVASLVQSWINNSTSNYGFLLKLMSETAGGYYQWNSDDLPNGQTLTPKLVVYYNDGSHALPPAVALGAPGPNATVTGSVPLTAFASDDGTVTRVEWSIDGGTPLVATTAPYTATLNSTTLSRGIHTLTLTAADTAGNWATTSLAINVANSAAPSVSYSYWTTAGGVDTLSVIATDDRAIARVDFFANGNYVGTATSSRPGVPMLIWKADTTATATPNGTGPSLTLSGNEITDASRAAGIQGDGRLSPDSSVGFWDATTNLLPNGGFESGIAGWDGRGGSTALAQLASGKFGTKALQATNGAAAPTVAQSSSVAVTAGASYTASAWVWGSGTAYVSFNERTSGDASVADYAGVTVTLTSTPQRISVTRTPGAGDTLARVVVTGSTAGTLNVDGVQLEQQAIATPYVDTNGAPSSRGAPAAIESAQSFASAQSWVALRIRVGWSSSAYPSAQPLLFAWGTDPSNAIAAYFSQSKGKLVVMRSQVGAGNIVAAPYASFNAGDYLTIVVAWDTTRLWASVNANDWYVNSNGNILPNLPSTFSIGSAPWAGFGAADADVLWFETGTGTLTSADVRTMTRLATTDPSFGSSTYSVRWNTRTALPGSPVIAYAADNAYAQIATQSIQINLSGVAITDATRATAIADDGRTAPDSSVGIWDSTTNLVANGGVETNASGWSPTAGASVSRTSAFSKFGAASLQVTTPGAAAGEGAQWSPLGVAPSKTYTFSAWLRGSGTVALALNETAAGAFVRTDQTVGITLGSSWTRVVITFTTGSTTDSVTPFVVTYGSAQAATYDVDGVQLEQKAIATPYVDTNGAVASRGAAAIGAPSVLLSPSQGWVAIRVRMGWSQSSVPNAAPGLFGWIGQDSTNRLGLYFDSLGRIVFRRDAGTSSSGYWFTTPSFVAGNVLTVIATWDATKLQVSINGGSFSWGSNTNTGPLGLSSTFWIGTWYTDESADSDILWFAAGTGTLSNSDVAAFTSGGDADPSLGGVYDGAYTLTAKTYDDDGQATSSTLSGAVTVTNTTGTKYRAGLTSTPIPAEMTYDPTLPTQVTWPLNVAITNNGTSPLLASQTVVRYRWYSGDDNPIVTTSGNIALPADIAAGGNTTVTVSVTPPTLPTGIYRGQYRLRIDLVDISTSTVYFADQGNAPLEQYVTVNLETASKLGLERFQQYDGADLGSGVTSSINLANGNNVISWTPWDEPGRGLDTVVSVTYNSLEGTSKSPLGSNFLLTVSGLTPLGIPLDVHPNASDALAGRSTPWIGFVDGDGSYFTFTGQTAVDGTVYWAAPAGVHLYLRQYSTTDNAHWWAITKPDRTTFFYDQLGNPTFVVDGNGNTITYTETAVATGDDAYGTAEHVTQITDAGGRAFTISYYTKTSTGFTALRGKIQSITDHLGHTITFDYYRDGNLLRATQTGGTNGDGSFTAGRSISFTYLDPANQVPNWWQIVAPDPSSWQTPRMMQEMDNRGNWSRFDVYLPGGTATWRTSAVTDRLGAKTSYSYSTSARTATVTYPAVTAPSGSSVSPVWTYAFDALGRVTSITDPVNSQPTAISWTADNAVARVTEPTGLHVDYAHNQNGYLTDTWDELGSHTVLSYQDIAVDANDVSGKWEAGRATPHISQLVATSDPGANLIGNDGFELGTTGWTDGGTAQTTLVRDTSTAAFGVAALKASGVDASHYPTIRTNPAGLASLVAGATYTFTVWVNAPAGTSMDAAAYRSDFSTLLGRTTFTGTGSWQLVQLSFVAAASEQAYVYVRSTSAFNGGSFWIDTAGLTARTSPSGSQFSYTMQFDYDANGNPLHTSDPLGNVTTDTYNADGTLATETAPANGDGIARVTTYNTYDANGLATQVTDAAGGINRLTYDAAGNLLAVQDPNHASYSGGNAARYQTQYVYDRFDRLVRTSQPKSTQYAPGLLIWSDVTYDANDNVVSALNPHYGLGDSLSAPVTTTVYDLLDQATLVTSPDTVGGLKQVQTVYDVEGRVVKVVQPLGVATTNLTKDYSSVTVYDLLGRPYSTTQYVVDVTDTPIASQTRTVFYCYDLAGDLRSVTGPQGAASFSACPAAVSPGSYTYTTAPDTTKIVYDGAHRQIQVVDALGQTTSQTYDANANVLSSTDENGNTTYSTYDARGELIKTVEPFDTVAGRVLTTLYVYDALGELSKEIDPRAYDASTDKVTFTDFVTTYSYDALGRLVKTTLPSQGGVSVAYLHNAYDANSNLLWTSLPTLQSNPANVAAGDNTTNQYWDNGLLYSTQAPAAPKVRYDYTAEGWQSVRIPETAIGSGVPDYSRMLTWSYFADGKLKEQVDEIGLRDTFGYDLNGNEISTTEALGQGAIGSAQPITVTVSYDQLNEMTKVVVPKPNASTYWATLFTYDQHGNAISLTQNQLQDASGNVITAGRTQTYTYDYNDQPTSQIDDFATSATTADDEKMTFIYTPTGLESSHTLAKSDGAGGWVNEQQVSESYYANGLLKTLVTTDGGSPATTISSHTLSYITAAGIYMNDNRVSDLFQLRGPDSSAACYSTTCTASWQYDARDRLVEEVNGTGTTVDYTLDVYGNSTQETTNGTVSRTATYNGLQLQTDTAGGVTKKYLYDSAGNLACVTTTAWASSSCPALYYNVAPDPSLITWNLFDSKNRLAGTWSFSAGVQTDGAIYTLDSLDRVLSESEWHSGAYSRTDFTFIGLSSAIGQEQLYSGIAGSGGSITWTQTETKSYVYDALGRPMTITDTPVGGSTSRYSYAFDPHGSVEVLLDQSRNVKAAYGYSAYGSTNLSLTKTAAGFSPNTNALEFQSERFDTGSKTIDFGARHYSPNMERFVQRDSYQSALDDLGLSTDPLNGNRYALTGANPVNFVDLDGHRASRGGLGTSFGKSIGPKSPTILITTPGPKAPTILITTPGPKSPTILITTPGPKINTLETITTPCSLNGGCGKTTLSSKAGAGKTTGGGSGGSNGQKQPTAGSKIKDVVATVAKKGAELAGAVLIGAATVPGTPKAIQPPAKVVQAVAQAKKQKEEVQKQQKEAVKLQSGNKAKKKK